MLFSIFLATVNSASILEDLRGPSNAASSSMSFASGIRNLDDIVMQDILDDAKSEERSEDYFDQIYKGKDSNKKLISLDGLTCNGSISWAKSACKSLNPQ